MEDAKINSSNKKGLKIAILLILMVIISIIVVLLLLNKKDSKKVDKPKNDNNEKINEIISTLEKTEMVVNYNDDAITLSEKDTPLDIISNKKNLYGIKLSKEGTFESYCGSEINYSLSPLNNKSLEFSYDDGSYELDISNDKNKVNAIYFVEIGGCNSSIHKMFLIDYNDKIASDDEYEFKITNKYVMLYTLSLRTGICDVACDEGISNYIIGETENGDMYILTSEGEVKVDDTLKFGYDFYEKDEDIEIMQDTKIYGTTIISGDKTIKAFPEDFN